MVILVSGGREYTNHLRVWEILNALHKARSITRIIEGGARGTDTFARNWAKHFGIPFRTFEVTPQEWNSYLGHRAGNRRNQRMLDEGQPDLVVIFPGGNGTHDMWQRSALRKKLILVIDDPVHHCALFKGDHLERGALRI